MTIHYEATIVHSLPAMKKFRCAHCEAVFSTTKWYRTKRGYSAACPCCPYQAWTPR